MPAKIHVMLHVFDFFWDGVEENPLNTSQVFVFSLSLSIYIYMYIDGSLVFDRDRQASV